MKIFLLALSILSTQAFAFEVCSLTDTGALNDAVSAGEMQHLRTVEAGSNYETIEKNLITETMLAQDFGVVDQVSAILLFEDRELDETTTGGHAGSIEYYLAGQRKFVMVHFYPGDNEYGSLFELRGRAVLPLATIGDGEINCY